MGLQFQKWFQNWLKHNWKAPMLYAIWLELLHKSLSRKKIMDTQAGILSSLALNTNLKWLFLKRQMPY